MKSRSKFALRVRVLAVIAALIALLFAVRLYLVQIVHGAEYRQEAQNEYVRQSQNQVNRGSIFFTAKDGTLISAATIASGDTIAINPQKLADPAAAYQELKKYLPGLDENTFLAKAAKKTEVYEEVARQVPTSVGNSIIAQSITGVQVLAETWRYYPGGPLASHEIGFLAYGPDGVTLTGQYGLERYYNDVLSRSSAGLYVNFFADLFTNIRSELFSNDAQPGADLTTSIEPTVQRYLEGEMQKYDATWHPDTAGGIVMDPSTGDIIAMASTPGFDPNNFGSADPATFKNPMVSNVYEFGSVMKAITMAAGIDSGAVTPNSTYDDTGYMIVDGSRINNWDFRNRGVVSMQTVLNESLNTGAAFVAEQMGTTTFANYFKKFGIEEETGIDLPAEASPLVANLSSPRHVEYDTAAFGQGIAITPIAMTRALATLANHGQVPSPHLGIELDYGGGITKSLNWSPPRQAISSQSADTISRMLVAVMDEALQGGKVKLPDYSVAVKTGTAQVADPVTHDYYPNEYLHSYFGYFPAFNAKFIIFFFALNPHGAPYASDTWTTEFIDTVKFLINYYNIPPDRAPVN